MTPEQKLLYDKWSNYYNIRGYSNNEGTRYDLLQHHHVTTQVEFLDQSYTPDTTRTTATRAMLNGQLSTTVSCIASTIDIPLDFDLFTIHNPSKTETEVSTEKSVKKLTSNHHSSAVFEPTDGTETILTTGSIGEVVKEKKKVDRSTFYDHAKGIDCSKNSIEHCDDIVVPEMMMMMIHPYSLARNSTDTAATTVCDESRNQRCFTESTTFNDDTTNDLRQFAIMRHHIQQVTAGTPDNISLHHPPKQIESLELVAAAQGTSREDVRGKSRTNPVITANCSNSNRKKKKKIQCDDYTTKALIQAVLEKHQKMLIDSQLAAVDTTITPPTRRNNCDPESSKYRDTAVAPPTRKSNCDPKSSKYRDTAVAPPTRKSNCDPKSSKFRDNADRTPGLVAKAGNKKRVDTSIRSGNTRSTEENETAETILRFLSKQDERQVNTDNNKQTERRSNLLPIHRNSQKKQRCRRDESTRLQSTSSHSKNRAESTHKQRPSQPMILPYPSIAQHHYLSPPPPPPQQHHYLSPPPPAPPLESTRLRSTPSHSMNRAESTHKQRPSQPMILQYSSIAQRHYLVPQPPPASPPQHHHYLSPPPSAPPLESTRLQSTSSHSKNRAESNHKQRPSQPMIPYPPIAHYHYLSPRPPPPPPPPPLVSSKKPKLAMASPQNCSKPNIAIENPGRTAIVPIAPQPPYARFHHPHQLSTVTNTVPTAPSFDYRGSIAHSSQFGAVRRESHYGPSVSHRGRSSMYRRQQSVSLAQPSATLLPHSAAIPTNHSKNGLPTPAYDSSRKDFEPRLKRQHGRSVEYNELNLTRATGTSGGKYNTSKKPTSTNADLETDIGVLRRVNETWKKRYFELSREEGSDDVVEVIVVDE